MHEAQSDLWDMETCRKQYHSSEWKYVFRQWQVRCACTGHRRPRYHESPVALRVGLGWLKAKGVNLDSKSGVEPRRRLNGILVTFRQLLHSGTPPSRPNSLSRHWIRYTGTREWGWSRASLPRYNPSHAQVMTSPSAALLTDFAHGHLRQRRTNNTFYQM